MVNMRVLDDNQKLENEVLEWKMVERIKELKKSYD